MARIVHKTLLLLAIVTALTCCTKPQEGYHFISTNPLEADETPVFQFDADLSDTTLSYSTEIVCRYNTKVIPDTCINFIINAISPSGRTYQEKVSLPILKDDERVVIKPNNHSINDILWPYRTNIKVSTQDAGIWKMIIVPADKEVIRGILGIGFSYHIEQSK